jgi:hypothetical protein
LIEEIIVRVRRRVYLTVGLMVVFLALAAGAARAQQFHRLESAVPLKSAAPDWDYLSFDPARGRLFIAARGDGMMVYDVRGRKVLGTLENTKGANASALVPEFDRGYTVNLDGSSTVFQLSTLKTIDKIKLGEDADAAFYDPVTKQIAIMRGDSREMTFLDARSGAILARLPIESNKLEATAPDGHGNFFTALRDRNSVIKTDIAAHRVVAEWPIEGCQEANGLAHDPANRRLFVGCRGSKPVLAVIDADTGKTITTLEIGRGNDGVIYDPDTRKIYTSAGVDANLVIYDQVDADTYKLAEATTTRPYARTMALDPGTKKLYLVTAEGTVDPSRKVNKGPAPFYPNRYFPGTLTLLTFSPR